MTYRNPQRYTIRRFKWSVEDQNYVPNGELFAPDITTARRQANHAKDEDGVWPDVIDERTGKYIDEGGE